MGAEDKKHKLLIGNADLPISSPSSFFLSMLCLWAIPLGYVIYIQFINSSVSLAVSKLRLALNSFCYVLVMSSTALVFITQYICYLRT